MRLALFGIVVALFGCVPRPPELAPLERAAGAAALEGWRLAGLPPPNVQRCDVRRFRIETPDASGYFARCRSASTASAGCLNWSSSGHWFRPISYPVVVVSPRHYVEPHIIVHELMHAMWQCAELGSLLDAGNRQHADPRVWMASGAATSAQGRAMALIADAAAGTVAPSPDAHVDLPVR